MFSQKVKKLLISISWNGVLEPLELLDSWAQFVDDCLIGYEMNIYEYENGLSIRNVIEEILCKKSLQSSTEFEKFANSVSEIDEKFKDVLLPDIERKNKFSWWEKGILSRAGEEYVNDIKDKYLIEIQVI